MSPSGRWGGSRPPRIQGGPPKLGSKGGPHRESRHNSGGSSDHGFHQTGYHGHKYPPKYSAGRLGDGLHRSLVAPGISAGRSAGHKYVGLARACRACLNVRWPSGRVAQALTPGLRPFRTFFTEQTQPRGRPYDIPAAEGLVALAIDGARSGTVKWPGQASRKLGQGGSGIQQAV